MYTPSKPHKTIQTEVLSTHADSNITNVLSSWSGWRSINGKYIHMYTIWIPPIAGLTLSVYPVPGFWITGLPSCRHVVCKSHSGCWYRPLTSQTSMYTHSHADTSASQPRWVSQAMLRPHGVPSICIGASGPSSSQLWAPLVSLVSGPDLWLLPYLAHRSLIQLTR